MICLITLIAASAFAEDKSGYYVQTTKVYETFENLGDNKVGIDQLDMDLIQHEIGWMQSTGWNVLSITPVQVAMPTDLGNEIKLATVTRYVIVVYEQWVRNN